MLIGKISDNDILADIYIFKNWQWFLRCHYQTVVTKKCNCGLIIYSLTINLTKFKQKETQIQQNREPELRKLT